MGVTISHISEKRHTETVENDEKTGPDLKGAPVIETFRQLLSEMTKNFGLIVIIDACLPTPLELLDRKLLGRGIISIITSGRRRTNPVDSTQRTFTEKTCHC
jgi:hypothetical protein